MNIDYRAFIRDNIAFARTIVIKNEDIAIADNQLMLRYYGIPIPQDKSQWRYYLNLAGEYHQTDDMMTVKSLDNEEIIPFTKASLDNHPATRKAYRLGSYYFSRLAAKYPHQIELIQGIINPITYEEAVTAKNYQILRYTKSYVEWNESQLIPLLQAHINGMTYQSFSTEYKFTDNLMLPFLVAHLRETVLRFILTCRFEHRFGRSAHSFFVWSYLQSRGISKTYKPFLSNHQTMWLFRNIDYLLRHLGKSENFDLLIEHLLSERDIALTKYDLIQSTETLSETLTTTPLFHSERINLVDKKGKGEDIQTLPVVMTKEIPESLDNDDYYAPYLKATTYESTFGEINSYPTKILESEMIDATNSKTETFFMLLNNELIYLAAKDLYTINLDIEDPLTGIHHTIPVKDAIVLWHDLLNLYHGIDNDKIGYFYYQGVMKITPPSLSAIMKLGTLPFLNEEWCRDALKLHIPQIRIVSPTVFYENALAIFHTKWKHKKMASFWASWGYVSQRQNAVDSLYEIGFAKLTSFTSFKALREKYQFDFSGYEKSHILSLMWVLWRKMTGWDNFSHQTLAQLQEALINLMRHLSSYSLQYIYQTSVESGWYEAGIDLMTENPSLANRGDDPGNEMDNDAEGGISIIDENKVLTIEESVAVAEYRLAILHFDTEYEDTATDALWDNMTLTLVEFDKDIGTEGDIHTFPLYLNMVPTLAYANVEDSLDKIIPTVGDIPTYYALSSVFTPFDGLLAATPYTTVTMQVVKNGFDNANVLYDYHGLDTSPETLTQVDGEKRHYDMRFVPAEPGDYILRLDIVTQKQPDDNTVNARFDYPYTVIAPAWSITYTVPDTVETGTPFEITPVITGLTLSGGTVTNQAWQVDDSVRDYLTVEEKAGKVIGTFLTDERPDTLPLHHCLTVGDGADERQYYMTGTVPQPKPYDPVEDGDFTPVLSYNEAVKHALINENIRVLSSKADWSVTQLELVRIDGDNIADDYLNMKGWLSPTLTPLDNTTVDGKTYLNWELRYGVIADNVTLTLQMTLTSTAGKTFAHTFTFTPPVRDYGATNEFWVLPTNREEDQTAETTWYLVPDEILVDIGMTGISGVTDASNSRINAKKAVFLKELGDDPVLRIPVDYTWNTYVRFNQLNQLHIWPKKEPTTDPVIILSRFEGVITLNSGEQAQAQFYGIATIQADHIVDYEIIDFTPDRFESWGTDDKLYQDATVPVRKAALQSARGWVFTGGVMSTNWPDYIPPVLGITQSSYDAIGVTRQCQVGNVKDGDTPLPEKYAFWVTFNVLYQPTVNMPETALLPVTVYLTNKHTGKKVSTELQVPFTFSQERLFVTSQPDKVYAGETVTLTPDWADQPIAPPVTQSLKATSLTVVDANMFSDDYSASLKGELIDHTRVSLTLPPPPLSHGRGIYLVRTTRYTLPDNNTSSLAYSMYYQIVDFVYNVNIFTTERPES